MADIELVINIDKKDYEKIRETSFVENTEIMFKQSSEDRKDTMMLFRVIDAIKNGTLLPKGHGKLKDIDKIISDGISKGFCDWYDEMEYAPTIIEADKTESEE